MPVDRALSAEEQESAIRAYLRGGTFRAAGQTKRGALYGIIKRHPDLHARLKEEYRIEVVLGELGLGHLSNVTLEDLQPLLGITGTVGSWHYT
jgi:hypothetical protein